MVKIFARDKQEALTNKIRKLRHKQGQAQDDKNIKKANKFGKRIAKLQVKLARLGVGATDDDDEL